MTANSTSVGSRLSAGVMRLDNTTPPPVSRAVPAERLVQRVGPGGQLVLVRTDENLAASVASTPQRRVVVLQPGMLPGMPEPDVLYRAPQARGGSAPDSWRGARTLQRHFDGTDERAQTARSPEVARKVDPSCEFDFERVVARDRMHQSIATGAAKDGGG